MLQALKPDRPDAPAAPARREREMPSEGGEALFPGLMVQMAGLVGMPSPQALPQAAASPRSGRSERELEGKMEAPDHPPVRFERPERLLERKAQGAGEAPCESAAPRREIQGPPSSREPEAVASPGTERGANSCPEPEEGAGPHGGSEREGPELTEALVTLQKGGKGEGTPDLLNPGGPARLRASEALSALEAAQPGLRLSGGNGGGPVLAPEGRAPQGVGMEVPAPLQKVHLEQGQALPTSLPGGLAREGVGGLPGEQSLSIPGSQEAGRSTPGVALPGVPHPGAAPSGSSLAGALGLQAHSASAGILEGAPVNPMALLPQIPAAAREGGAGAGQALSSMSAGGSGIPLASGPSGQTTPVSTWVAPAGVREVLPHPVVQQVDGSIRWLLKGGEKGAELQLHPESLGRVTIHLSVEGQEVHARVWASEASTLPILQEQRASLEVSLREQGLSLGSFDLQQGQRGRDPEAPASIPKGQWRPERAPDVPGELPGGPTPVLAGAYLVEILA